MWAEQWPALCCSGVTKRDIIHVAYGTAFYRRAGRSLRSGEAWCISSPCVRGNTKRQVRLLQDFGATVLCCTPSYALHISEVASEMNVSPGDLRLRVGFFGAEPWSESMRQELESKFGIDAIDIYGLSEVLGPGVGSECLAKNGLHIWEDTVIVEIIDPETNEVLPDGCPGELVFTSIRKEACPIIRYRTRDISSITRGRCECGRTTLAFRITGRTDDMIIVRVNVSHRRLRACCLKSTGSSHYQIVVDRAALTR